MVKKYIMAEAHSGEKTQFMLGNKIERKRPGSHNLL
jgi:hypothetical protein